MTALPTYTPGQYAGGLGDVGNAGYAQSGSYGQSTYQPGDQSNNPYALPSFWQHPIQWIENEFNGVPGTTVGSINAKMEAFADEYGLSNTPGTPGAAMDDFLVSLAKAGPALLKVGLVLAVIVVALIAYKDLK